MVHHKSSQCPDNSIIIFAYICDISLQHSTTFYNALPFGTWRKNIYTNQLPPNIENSFSCLGGFFFLWDFVHLIFSEGQDQATSAIFPHGPANSASNHRWHPRQTGPFLGPTDAHRAAESVWDRYGIGG